MKTATEAAKALALNESTIRSWAKQFGLPSQKKAGKRIFDDQTVAVLQKISELKSIHAGYDTITRVINVQTRMEPNVEEPIQSYTIDIKGEIKAALAESNDLAEKYARATYRIGELESENRMVLAQLEESKAKNLLLEEKNTQQNKTWWQKLMGR